MKTLLHGFALLRLLALMFVLAGVATWAMAAKTYSDNGDGTVTDPTTGLVWMRCSMGQVWDGTNCTGTAKTYTFDEANALTGKVTFAGKGDWRLPNIRELQTIVDWSVDQPTIDMVAFPNTSASYFWSASAIFGNPGLAWGVDFGYGGAVDYGKSSSYRVRLVRAGQSFNLLNVSRPSSDYVDHADGTVTHTPTGLMWQKCAVGQSWIAGTCTGTASTYTWSAAKQLTSNLAGQTDWRLPTAMELESLVDYNTVSPVFNPSIFPNTHASNFWSDTASYRYYSYSSYAWSVNFVYGSQQDENKSSAFQVRLVRAGQSFAPLVLNVNKIGAGTVSSALAGINCGATCTGNYTPGTQIILTATPASYLTAWSGACTGSAATCTVTVDAAKSVTATFKDTPLISGLPNALTFATQNIGSTSVAQTVTLSNTGSIPLTISSLVASGDYALSHNCGATLSVDGFCTINVTFSPTASGSRAGAITLTSDAPGSQNSIALNGTGLANTSVVSSSTLTFAAQGVGSASAAQTLTLSNRGGTVLNIASIGTTGDFSNTSTCGTTLAIGGQCSISVVFSPTAVGTRSGSVIISSDAASSPTTVSLSGISLAASQVVFSPTALGFAAVALGSSSAANTITLYNTGNAALSLTGMGVTGDYSQTNNCGGGLGLGASCRINIIFTPKSMGTHTGTLTVISNALGSPHTLALTSGPVASTVDLVKGWNLLGNGLDQPLTIATLLGDPTRVTTVWKWDVAQSGWQFYAPSMDATALQTYANNKSYGVLSQVNAGEGFWVNAAKAFSVTLPSGTAITASDFQDGKLRALKKGWNLIAIGNASTPSAFNMAISATPPTAGVVPINLTTLWAWDNLQSQWYFYAPDLESQGDTALTDYIVNKGYFDFTATHKPLGPGMGFWVNKP